MMTAFAFVDGSMPKAEAIIVSMASANMSPPFSSGFASPFLVTSTADMLANVPYSPCRTMSEGFPLHSIAIVALKS